MNEAPKTPTDLKPAHLFGCLSIVGVLAISAVLIVDCKRNITETAGQIWAVVQHGTNYGFVSWDGEVVNGYSTYLSASNGMAEKKRWLESYKEKAKHDKDSEWWKPASPADNEISDAIFNNPARTAGTDYWIWNSTWLEVGTNQIETPFLQITGRVSVAFGAYRVVRVTDSEWTLLTNHFRQHLSTLPISFYGKADE